MLAKTVCPVHIPLAAQILDVRKMVVAKNGLPLRQTNDPRGAHAAQARSTWPRGLAAGRSRRSHAARGTCAARNLPILNTSNPMAKPSGAQHEAIDGAS